MKFKIPKMETRIEITLNGRETGVTYTGEFVYVRPTIGDRGRIDVMEKRLNGDLVSLNDETILLHQALSHLRFTLKEFPDWWKDSNYGAGLYDGNVIVELYNKCMEYEAKFLEKLHSKDGSELEGNA